VPRLLPVVAGLIRATISVTYMPPRRTTSTKDKACDIFTGPFGREQAVPKGPWMNPNGPNVRIGHGCTVGTASSSFGRPLAQCPPSRRRAATVRPFPDRSSVRSLKDNEGTDPPMRGGGV
jgi:hypothetical protein